MDIDMNNDDIENEGSEENEESKINPIQENNHNYLNREISSGQLNQRSEGGNVNNRIEGSNHDLPSREQLADQRNRINNNDGKNGCNNSEGSNEHGHGNNGGDGLIKSIMRTILLLLEENLLEKFVELILQ